MCLVSARRLCALGRRRLIDDRFGGPGAQGQGYLGERAEILGLASASSHSITRGLSGNYGNSSDKAFLLNMIEIFYDIVRCLLFWNAHYSGHTSTNSAFSQVCSCN